METEHAFDAALTERHPFWAVAGLLRGRFGHQAHTQAQSYAQIARHQGDDAAQAIWTEVAGVLHPHAPPGQSQPAQHG